jgi:hypothetical protein
MSTKTQKWLGLPGLEKNLVILDVTDLPYKIYYDKKVVSSIRCHYKIADDLKHRLNAIWAAARAQVKKRDGYTLTSEHYDKATVEFLHARHLDVFGGCYNNRSIRGGTSMSMHAWGAAVDWNPAENALRTKGNMPAWWIAVWTQRIGDIKWHWGGSWTRRDPMHVEVYYFG